MGGDLEDHLMMAPPAQAQAQATAFLNIFVKDLKS
jgi:hypothetical protein